LNPTAAFAASKFPCLLIDGNADSRGTSAVFPTATLSYTVCKIFPSKSFVFDQIKSGFFSLLPFSRNFVEFMLKSGVFGKKFSNNLGYWLTYDDVLQLPKNP
jgi:hypothetical protein